MIRGGCMCGAVRFAAANAPETYAICHCEMCRRWAGSAFLEVSIPEGDVTWTGAEHIATRQSSDWAERAWCAQCGSTLYYRVTADTAWAGKYDIALGLFDDPSAFRLSSEIYIDHKPASFAFVDQDHETLTRAECVAKFPALDGPLTVGDKP